MYEYPSIEQYRNAAKNIALRTQYTGKDETGQPLYDTTIQLPTIEFVGTCKLDGSNAAIVKQNNIVTAQSRTRVITPTDDNYGFARWVKEHEEEFITNLPDNTVVWGEWAGKGVQGRTAVCQLEKAFYIFGAKNIITNDILDVSKWPLIPNTYNIHQFTTFNVVIDFNNPQPALDIINKLTLQVEENCPVGRYFNVTGIGEGIVWTPVDPKWAGESKFIFKTKGLKHENVIKKKAEIDPEKSGNVEVFIEKYVVEERLNQGLKYLKDNNIEIEDKSTGQFIKWVVQDVLKETKDEMVASNLTEKDVTSSISRKAREFYLKR